MNGTDKQIKWAKQILEDARDTIKANEELAKKNLAEYGLDFFADRVTAAKIVGEQFEAMCAKLNDASMVIDAKEKLSSLRMVELIEKTADKIRAERIANK